MSSSFVPVRTWTLRRWEDEAFSIDLARSLDANPPLLSIGETLESARAEIVRLSDGVDATEKFLDEGSANDLAVTDGQAGAATAVRVRIRERDSNDAPAGGQYRIWLGGTTSTGRTVADGMTLLIWST